VCSPISLSSIKTSKFQSFAKDMRGIRSRQKIKFLKAKDFIRKF